MIVSVINSYYGRYYLDSYSNYFIKEIVWFVVGLIIIYSLSKVNISFILDKSLYLYLIGIVLLVVTLIWGVNVNGSTSWINIFGFSFHHVIVGLHFSYGNATRPSPSDTVCNDSIVRAIAQTSTKVSIMARVVCVARGDLRMVASI